MSSGIIAIGADHRGVALKNSIAAWLEERHWHIEDCGTDSTESCDYPDFAHEVARRVSDGDATRGILICGSGIGMSMAANRHPAVRAVLCHDLFDAEMSRRHNDANVLCLAADRLESWSTEAIHEMVAMWMQTGFDGGRHQRRVDKIELSANVTDC